MNNSKFVQLELMKLKMDMMGVIKKLKSGDFANVNNKKETVSNEIVESIKKGNRRNEKRCEEN